MRDMYDYYGDFVDHSRDFSWKPTQERVRMPTFNGVVTDFEVTTKGFAFRISGVKYGYHGGNVKGIKNGDGVTGAYSVESFPDKKTGKTVNWNKVVEMDHSSTATANTPAVQSEAPVANSSAPMYGPLTSAPKQQYRGFGMPGGFPVAKDSYERCTLRRDCVRDAVSSVSMLKTPLEPKAIIAIAKVFEAYVAGDTVVEEAKTALEMMTSTDEE